MPETKGLWVLLIVIAFIKDTKYMMGDDRTLEEMDLAFGVS